MIGAALVRDEPGPSTDGTDGSWLPAPLYVASQEPEALWDRDLDQDQRGWRPDSGAALWRQVLPWRCESSVGELDGEVAEVIELTNAEPSWDWRTISFWSTALGPGWRVHLRHPGRVDLIRSPAEPPAR
jgi:hypothetical protein